MVVSVYNVTPQDAPAIKKFVQTCTVRFHDHSVLRHCILERRREFHSSRCLWANVQTWANAQTPKVRKENGMYPKAFSGFSNTESESRCQAHWFTNSYCWTCLSTPAHASKKTDERKVPFISQALQMKSTLNSPLLFFTTFAS